jgi:hypothetical protein
VTKKHRARRPQIQRFIEPLEDRYLLNAIGLRVADATSSSVTLNWNPVPNASAVRVYLAPEPSATTNGTLPNQVLMTTLGGSATSYHLTGVAPGVDAFLRVEATTSSGVASGNVHARTPGGPRAPLDFNLQDPKAAVREVHAYGPNILQVVLTDEQTHYTGTGNDGAAWHVFRQRAGGAE